MLVGGWLDLVIREVYCTCWKVVRPCYTGSLMYWQVGGSTSIGIIFTLFVGVSFDRIYHL